MEKANLIKITTNIGEYDLKITLEELKEKIANIGEDKILSLPRGEIKTNWLGQSWNDNVVVHLDLNHVNIYSIEEHDMSLNEPTKPSKT